jgi:hypothetical protein
MLGSSIVVALGSVDGVEEGGRVGDALDAVLGLVDG